MREADSPPAEPSPDGLPPSEPAPSEPPAKAEPPPPSPPATAARLPGVASAVLAATGIAILLGLAFGTPAPASHLGPHDAGLAPEDASTDDASTGELAIVDAEAPLADVVDAGPKPPPRFRVAQLKNDSALEYVEFTLGKRTLSAALGAAHLSAREQARLFRAFEGRKRFDRLGPKDLITFAKDKQTGKLVAFEFASSPLDVWQARENDEGVLVADKLEFVVSEVRIEAALRIDTDLRAAVEKAGLHPELAKELDEALEGQIEIASLKPGARFRLIATETRTDGDFSHYARIDAVEYVSPRASDDPIRVYHYARHRDLAPDHETRADGRGRREHPHPGAYYDKRGQHPYHGAFRSPIPAARITSRFNPRRMHPVLHVVMPHNGIDFSASTGTPVYASSAGVVRSAGDSGPCGNMVSIQHEGGIVTAYCHLSRFAAGIHAGLHVETRQLIGYAGATGRVTGPHLHFAAKRGEAFIDPQGLKLDGVKVIPNADRDAFQKVRAELDVALEKIALSPPSGASAGTTPSGAPSPGPSGVDGGADEDEVNDLPDPQGAGPGAPPRK